MYKVIKDDGTVLGLTDTEPYIKISNSGCFIFCPQSEAIGAAFDSTAYNLAGHEDIAGAETVYVTEVDSGKAIDERASYAELAAAIKEGVNSI